MRHALAEAHCAPHEVEWICAHGSSTPLNDDTEVHAIGEVFSEHTAKVPMSGTKGWHAHALGATGAIEAAIAALVMTRGWIPPTLNCVDPASGTGLRHVPERGLTERPAAVLKNSFGFGGCNATLVLRDGSM